MPLFLDRHDLPEATAEDLAQAHLKDLATQQRHGVRYLTYWFDPDAATAFCLAEGPDSDSVNRVHLEAHGIVANRILQVDQASVVRFLGRISDHPPGESYVETALRTIFFTDLTGSTDLTSRLGDARAMELLRTHDRIVRRSLSALEGTEVKHTGDGIMASFASVARAVESAAKVQRDLMDHNAAAPVPIHVRVGLSAGEPVTEHGDLFGAAVQMAARVCAAAGPEEVLVTAAVRELAMGKGYRFEDRGGLDLKGFDEPVHLFAVLWRT